MRTKLGGSSRLPLLFRQLGKPVEGRHVGRIGRDQKFQFAALGGDVAPMGGEPGVDPMELGGIRLRGWHVRHGLFHDVDPVGRDAPAQSGAPDRDIVRTALLASIEPALGLVVGAGSDRQVRSTQPDPIVVGRELGGLLENGADGLDRRGLQGQLDVLPNQFDGGLERPFSRCVQVFPPILDQALGFIDAALLAEHRHEQHEQGRPIIAGIEGGVVDEPLGGCKLPGFLRRDASAPRIAFSENAEPGATRAQASSAAWFRPRASSQDPRR